MKYKALIQKAKSIYDNPLMAYLYSGSNDEIGFLHLALEMQQAKKLDCTAKAYLPELKRDNRLLKI